MEQDFLSDVFLLIQKYISLINDSKSSSSEKSLEKVVHYIDPKEIQKDLPQVSDDGHSFKELKNDLEFVLEKSVKTIHPLFLNQLFGGFDYASWSGEVISSLLNPTMSTYEMSPVLSVMENQIHSELLKLVGFHEGKASMTTGGSNSNLLGLLCARTYLNPQSKNQGLGYNKYRVYVSEESHYSFDKAVNIAGLGTDNLVRVAVNSDGEMRTDELKRLILEDRANGLEPLMVGATLGTTVLGAFDPIEEIALLCKDLKIWLHVDAAWGGGAFFSSSLKTKLKGIHLADSLSIDAHKTLGTSLMTSFFLTSHSHILQRTTRGGGMEYLFHDNEFSNWDSGTYSLQCGRRGDILKMWCLWRYHGLKGLESRIDHLLDLTTYAKDCVSEHSRLHLVHYHYLNLCFQVLPSNTSLKSEHDIDINDYNLQIRRKILEDGEIMINYNQRPDGMVFFRLVFPNHQTQRNHVDHIMKVILSTADKIECLPVHP